MQWTDPEFVVIGLDVSLTGTGVASSHGWSELIGARGVSTLPLHDRVKAIDRLAQQITDRIGRPDLVAAESAAMVRMAGAVLERHALWWKIMEILTARGLQIMEVSPPSRAQYATGKGNAGKNQVVDAVARRFPDYETNGDDNLCDAIILCAMGADWAGRSIVEMPAINRKALSKVKVWSPPVLVSDVTQK